ncbi:Rab-GTPase-TBC domain [Trinorchestia longiramus]|nr:Rab-GTPase-TBC domain [Trinorchestia longiramus]
MDYSSTWQSLITTASGTGAVLLSHPSHYVNIASNIPTCRSIWWRLLLGVIPKDPSKWEESLTKQRQDYDALRKQLSVTPGVTEATEDLSLNNPLSQDTHSSWNQYFEDGEMKRLIRQDVERTFPEERFFHSPAIQEIMVTIIFCYAKQHIDVSFKQGLHEVLAPLLLVLQRDHRQYEEARCHQAVLPVIELFMNPSYLEHDAYALFCGVMQRLSKWYFSKEEPLPPRAQQQQLLLHAQPFAAPELAVNKVGELTPLLARIEHIHREMLPSHCPALAQHLLQLDIPPQVYAIRWLRLLFGREFALSDLPCVWDALFWCCSPDDFPLADHISIALLDCIKNELLAGDYLACLNLLMRFPQPRDVTALLASALQRHIALQHQDLRPGRQWHDASSVKSPALLFSSPVVAASPVLSTVSCRSSLPPLLLNINSPASHPLQAPNADALSRSGSTRARTASGGSNSSTSGVSNGVSSSVQRGLSLQGDARLKDPLAGVATRSRSQVTRCVSEGGHGERRGGRHPSASPRRSNTDHCSQGIAYNANRETVESDLLSSHKSNLLNFVKFGAVKFSKPKDPDDVDDAFGGRRMEPLSRPSQQRSRPLPVPKTSSYDSSEVVTSAVLSDSDHHTTSLLQRLAGELSGHLSALNDRHLQLMVDSDLSIKITMDSLFQVSRALQDVADGLHVEPATANSSPATSKDQQTATTFSHPLEHPLQASPD